jgi:pectate lyase
VAPQLVGREREPADAAHAPRQDPRRQQTLHIDGNSYCTNSGFEATLLVENNIYIRVNNPLSPDPSGDMLARSNVFTNTTGTTTATGTGFVPPYAYTPEPTGSLESAIRTGAGPH